MAVILVRHYRTYHTNVDIDAPQETERPVSPRTILVGATRKEVTAIARKSVVMA